MRYMRTHTFQTPAVKWDGTNVDEVREFLRATSANCVVEVDGDELVITVPRRIPLGALVDALWPSHVVPPEFVELYKPAEEVTGDHQSEPRGAAAAVA